MKYTHLFKARPNPPYTGYDTRFKYNVLKYTLTNPDVPYCMVADYFGISYQTVVNWVKKAHILDESRKSTRWGK